MRTHLTLFKQSNDQTESYDSTLSCLRKKESRAARASGRYGTVRLVQSDAGPIAEPIDADPEIFDGILHGTRVPILVDFWAAWCGPCRMAAPEVQKVAAQMASRAIVMKVDTQRWPALAASYNVMSIPNFVVIKNGRVVFQQPGFVDHMHMADWLRKAA